MPDASEGEPKSGVVAAGLNPLFHESARLAILSALAPAEYVEFSTLLQITGVSKSALSKHLSALSHASVVSISQGTTDKRGRRVALTAQGRSTFDSYLAHLEHIVRSARQ